MLIQRMSILVRELTSLHGGDLGPLRLRICSARASHGDSLPKEQYSLLHAVRAPPTFFDLNNTLLSPTKSSKCNQLYTYIYSVSTNQTLNSELTGLEFLPRVLRYMVT